MDLERFSKYAPSLVRVSIAGVFLWFGINQLLEPNNWTGFLPLWADNLPLSLETLIYLHGSFETILGAVLLVGYKPRIIAALLALSLTMTTIHLNYGPVMVRDIALIGATLSIVLHGDDPLTLPRLMRKG